MRETEEKRKRKTATGGCGGGRRGTGAAERKEGGRQREEEENTTGPADRERESIRRRSARERAHSGWHERQERGESPLFPASSQTNGPSPDAEVARFLRRSFKFTFTD